MTNQNIVNSDQIHEVVRERYGTIASAAASDVKAVSCCGANNSCCDDSCGATLYDPLMLEGLPADVSKLSLGCGDPISIASLNAGETVLDLGSGGGIVDMTPEMLARANASKEKMGVSNVEFRRGQIEALPVDDSSVDVVMSNCVINLSPDKRAVFGEAYRVLKPGGRVSISDIVADGDFSPELRSQVDKWAECVTGAIDVALYTGLMREVGFANIQVMDKSDASQIVSVQPGMPRVYSARITARKV